MNYRGAGSMSPANVMSLPMPEPDPLESELPAGAVTALRRRATRETDLARLRDDIAGEIQTDASR